MSVGILERMRFAGKRPAGFIVVTESREIAFSARRHGFLPIVFNPAKPHDWRVLKALDVALVTRLKREQVAQACVDVMDADPRSFVVTYDDGETCQHETVYAPR